jgi:hypothetical protein
MTKAQRNAAKSDVCALVHVDPHAAIRRRSGEEIGASEMARNRTVVHGASVVRVERSMG